MSEIAKKLLSYGIPLKNYVWLPSKSNIVDIATRLDSMGVDNVELFLGEWIPDRHFYAKNSKFFGSDPVFLSYNSPILFRYRSTNVQYDFNLFHLGLIDKPQRGNLRNSRNMFIRTVKNNKIQVVSIPREDIIPLVWEAQNLNITDNELKGMGLG